MNIASGTKLIRICAAMAILLLAGCRGETKVTVLKLAHALDIVHPVHRGMVFMSEKVREHSNGKIRIDIYPGGQLGAERELIELLQIGSLAMTKVSTAPLEAFVPEMQIFGIPYLFKNQEHRWKVLNSPTGKDLLLAGERFFCAVFAITMPDREAFIPPTNRSVLPPI